MFDYVKILCLRQIEVKNHSSIHEWSSVFTDNTSIKYTKIIRELERNLKMEMNFYYFPYKKQEILQYMFRKQNQILFNTLHMI